MTKKTETRPRSSANSGAVNGIVCAFALLVETLESNGSLKPKQFEQLLGAVLSEPGMDSVSPDVAVLHDIVGLLRSAERTPLTLIAGGKA